MQTTRRQTLMFSLAMLAGAGTLRSARADDAWQSGRIAGAGEDALERELADGTLLRLAGILPAPGRGWSDRLAGALAVLLPDGAELGFRALATDRYGRTLAVLAPPVGSTLPDLQSLLLAQGLAWAWPEPEAIDLHDGWLAQETPGPGYGAMRVLACPSRSMIRSWKQHLVGPICGAGESSGSTGVAVGPIAIAGRIGRRMPASPSPTGC